MYCPCLKWPCDRGRDVRLDALSAVEHSLVGMALSTRIGLDAGLDLGHLCTIVVPAGLLLSVCANKHTFFLKKTYNILK
jgi:hypothetical protein